MAKPRQLSQIGIYHIIMKGVDHQSVFFNERDKELFVSLLKRYSKKLDISVIAYTLMDNHIHIEVKVNGAFTIGEMVKRLCISYVQHYFNREYFREGSLFQSRFFSRPIKDDEDLLTVARYIYFNPLKKGLEGGLNYRFSSYAQTLSAYEMSKKRLKKQFLDASDIRRCFSGRQSFLKFIDEEKESVFFEEGYRIDDKTIKERVLLKDSEGNFIPTYDTKSAEFKLKIDELLRNNVSLSRICRVTRIDRGELLGLYAC